MYRPSHNDKFHPKLSVISSVSKQSSIKSYFLTWNFNSMFLTSNFNPLNHHWSDLFTENYIYKLVYVTCSCFIRIYGWLTFSSTFGGQQAQMHFNQIFHITLACFFVFSATILYLFLSVRCCKWMPYFVVIYCHFCWLLLTFLFIFFCFFIIYCSCIYNLL